MPLVHISLGIVCDVIILNCHLNIRERSMFFQLKQIYPYVLFGVHLSFPKMGIWGCSATSLPALLLSLSHGIG